MSVVAYKSSKPVARKDYDTDMHDYIDFMLIKQQDGTWKCDPEQVKYLQITPSDVEIIEKRANDKFRIYKGDKYFYQTGIFQDEGPFTFRCPLDIHEIMNKYDLWPDY